MESKFGHLEIPLEEVVNATDNFANSNIIANGVYKGQLWRSGKLIKIYACKRRAGDVMFWKEISVLSDLKHTNLVSFIGFCYDKHEKIIVTTHEANGSLILYLGSPKLTWTQRLGISVGAARALSYLHHGDQGRHYGVIHRDINSYTVLLDRNWEAKLSGFEFSVKQTVERIEEVVPCEPVGTVGYFDPTIERTGGASLKNDIYSFGVLLFELLCGRPAYINEAVSPLAPLAKYHYEHGTLKNIINPQVWNQILSPESLLRYLEIAYSCLKEEPTHRPDSTNIVDQLEQALKLHQLRENQIKNMEHLKIRLNDIQVATDNFSEAYIIGSSKYLTFYRAELDHFDIDDDSFVQGENNGEHAKRHNTVAIKRIKYMQTEEYFYNSIEMLTNVKHRNIVALLGFCVDGSEMILVTENFCNGSLDEYLGNVNSMRILTWENRLKICIDVAQSLNYLHSVTEDQKMIINSCVNRYNIWLDENWRAKIVEFGMSKILPLNEKDKGIYFENCDKDSYLDPKYEETGKLRRESDVYSFGVVLFEMLCGKKADDPIYLKTSDKGLAHVARQLFYWETLEKMIDPIIMENTCENSFVLNKGSANGDSLNTFIKIAYDCVAETEDQRPTMTVVVKQLEEALYFQIRNEPVPVFQRILLKMIPIVDACLISCFSCESTIQERSQCPNTDQVADRDVNALEVRLTNAIPGKKLEQLKIRLTDIQIATNGFSPKHKIAYRDSYTCFRAKLEHFNFSSVIIKQMSSEEHFVTEIEVLTRVKHPKIASLFGFCVEGSEMILVNDDVSKGYLADHLTNKDKRHLLTWEKRLKICIDVAHALNYLHSAMDDKRMIIHGDICSYNIGLDENWGAKIVCFKDSVFLPPNQEDEALNLGYSIGRPLYVDPEYKEKRKLKRESDVYSFGVVLLEILCGRLANDPIYMKENNKGLAAVARRSFYAERLVHMIDPLLNEEFCYDKTNLNRGPNKDSLHTFTQIATRCVAETQDHRPTMEAVIMLLEKALFFHENKDNRKISLVEIKRATQSFHKDNLIGKGGFGSVYIGNLQDGNGINTVIAAKQLNKRSAQGEQQFLNELRILSEYEHENVIGLVGYCNEEDEQIIVFEYASNRSLDGYLHKPCLTWVMRLNICIEVASALYFLHGGFGKRAKLIHRDIKTPNILLNHVWKAKLADFGLSLISPISQKTDYVIDHLCGTPGYLDPLYEKSRMLTMESDIYSFGVVLFEILCGRSTHSIYNHKGHHLPDFIKSSFKEEKHDEVVFEQIRKQIEPKSLKAFQKIAYQCLDDEKDNRPTIKEILAELTKASVIQAAMAFTHLQIPLKDVAKATNNFHHDNIIEHGGLGTTYKGQLLWSGRLMMITARRFDCKSGEEDLKFLTEISVLSDLNHKNLVSIIGFCDEQNEKIIVTTYEANGSLGQYLQSPNLTWTQRLKICLGVARALSYLHYHKGRDSTIIHCNISSDTILLDKNWEAKLSGFEISIKQSVHYEDKVCLCEHIGAMGRMDPAIEKTGGVTRKSDIYSFGVLLFEILCGRKAFVNSNNNDDRFLAPMAKYHYENNKLHDIILGGLHKFMKSVFICSDVAYSCLNEDPARRPSMDYIVYELDGALQLQLSINNHNIGKSFESLKIPLTSVKFATHNFSKTYKILENNYYTCYRAEISLFDKPNPSSVLIKRISPENEFYQRHHFVSEFEVLTRVKHPNIASLYGFCNEDSEMILVTENVSNGHLLRYWKGYGDRSVLTWETRLRICMDVAHALNYLHFEMEDQKMIVHRDICSENIGLVENWGAKIVGFEESVNQEGLATKWRKRQSYTDPSSNAINMAKKVSDVYSFGVVLFESLCGRSADDLIYHGNRKKGMAYVARQSYSQGTLEEMIDPIINDGPNEISLYTFIDIGIKCLAKTQDRRPTMKFVIKELEKALFYQINNLDHLKMPFTDIQLATDNFLETYIIASRSCYTCYRAKLHQENPSSVVVKRISSGQKAYRKNHLVAEIKVLTCVKHPNIVNLLGFCVEGSEMILVIDNVSNGYLGDYLENDDKRRILTWEKRLKICVDVAHALNYLHSGVEDQKIINRDIYSYNIGLDENWGATIVGFEDSIFLPLYQEALYLDWRGRSCYIDPEYKKTNKLKTKSDVYSFGVVLFEVLCGRLADDPIYKKESDIGLAHVARRRYYMKTLEDMIDPMLKEEANEYNFVLPNKDSLHTFIEIAHQCVTETQDQRPTMKVVVKELEKALFFQENKDNPKILPEDIKLAIGI